MSSPNTHAEGKGEKSRIYHCVFDGQKDVGQIPEYVGKWSGTLMLMTIVTVGAYLGTNNIDDVHACLKTTTPVFTLKPLSSDKGKWSFQAVHFYERASIISKTSHTYEQDINAPIYAAFRFQSNADRKIESCIYATTMDDDMVRCHREMLDMSRSLQLTIDEAFEAFDKQTVPGRLRLAMGVPIVELDCGKKYILFNGRAMPTT